MARRVILDTQYTFSPSTKTITIPRIVPRERLLLITNLTTNKVIYNFSDPTLTITSYSYTQPTNTNNAITTVVLSAATGAMNSTDQLQIVVDEAAELFAPDEAYLDPVGKFRTSTPQALIDVDFEYGLQPTKWETVSMINNRPAFFVNTQTPQGATGAFATNGSASIVVSTATQQTQSTPVLVQDTAFGGANGPFLIETSVAAGTSYVVSAAAAGAYSTGQGLSVVLTVTSGSGFVAGAQVTISGITGALAGYNTSTINPAYVLVGGTTSITVLFPALSSSLGTSLAGSPVIQQSSYFTYTARYNYTGTTGSIFNLSLTNSYSGQFYTGAAYTLPSQPTIGTGGLITVTTTEPHGLQIGDGVYIANTSVSSGTNIVSSYNVATVSNSTVFAVYSVNSPTNGATVTNAVVYPRPDGTYFHRPFDGGVQFTAQNQAHNQQVIRQTRRYFRYQSGKGIQISTGTLMKPNINVDELSSSGTTVTVTCKQAHLINAGVTIVVNGANETAYNGTFAVTTILDAFRFQYTALTTPSATPASGIPTFSITAWYGASVRLGLFDSQNGMFFEFNGQTLYAVRRRSTDQLAGWVNVTNGSAVVTGQTVNGATTKFSKQLVPGDYVVIRGMSYRVLDILSDTSMTISPPYRGASTIYPNLVTVSKTVETRVAQSAFNIDKLDGTGPSGYLLDLSKMQMFYMDYSWYGAGALRFGFRDTQGKVFYVHRFVNNNQNTEAWMRSGNLPARYEVNTVSPTTQLAATITSNATTLLVNSTVGFPTSGTLLIADQTGFEYVNYTGITSSSFTGLTRGQSGGSVATVTTVNGSSILTTSSSVASLQAGMVVTGAGIQNGTYIVSVTTGSPNTIIISQAATASASVTISTYAMGSTAAQHTYSATAPIGIYLHAPQFAPTLSHWGTSVIMDGQFDNDKSLQFTYGETATTAVAAGNVASIATTLNSTSLSVVNTVPLFVGTLLSGTGIAPGTIVTAVSAGSPNNTITLSAAAIATGTTTLVYNGVSSLMSLRISPSVDSGIPSTLGLKELVNRMQLTLVGMDVICNGNFLIQLYLNGIPVQPTNSFTSYNLTTPAIGTYARIATGTSSLAQIADHSGPVYTTGGEVMFSYYAVNTAGSSNFSVTSGDLSKIRDLGNSILGGAANNTPGVGGTYPDGPDTLTIMATNIGSANASIQGRLSWTEAQA